MRRALVVAAAVTAWCAAARADPQWNLAATVGGGARALHTQVPDGVFSMGLRADVLFGRRTPSAPRVGPWVALRSDDIDDLTLAAGVSLQLPVMGDLPLMLGAGAVLEAAPTNRAGVLARIGWGPRSYNAHGSYVMAASVWVEARYFPGAGGADVIAGVDVDLRLLTIPALILYEYARGAR